MESARPPLVTIVTPCKNSEPYIATTIESVLAQDYPHVEYVLLDGGSTDGTVEVIEGYVARHPDKLRLVAEPDGGVAEALQKGLRQAKGEIFAYINADDTYFPGAIRAAVENLREHPEAAGVYGDAYWIDEHGERIGLYPTQPFSRENLAESCCICQPACFVRTAALRAAGGFDADFQVAFDYDLWLRMARTERLLRIETVMANSRMHRSNKTLRQRALGLREASRALVKHQGYVPFGWVHTYTSFLADGRDQFFEPLRPSFTKYFASLFVGTYLNWRRPWRFWKAWFEVMSVGGFVRRWNETWMARRLGLGIR